MFRRRIRENGLTRVRDLVWPRSGWRRTGSYLYHRMGRLSDTPHAIAAGFACGAAMSFTPFVGFHFLIAALLAWILGGNILTAAVGTVVGNPWTFPFIWLWTFRLGTWILGNDPGAELPAGLSFSAVFENVWLALRQLELGPVLRDLRAVVWPMAIGSLPTAFVVWWAVYWPLRRLVIGYQHARARRRVRREAAGERPRH